MPPAEWCAQHGVIWVEYPASFAASIWWNFAVTRRRSESCPSSVIGAASPADRANVGAMTGSGDPALSRQAASVAESARTKAMDEDRRVIYSLSVECSNVGWFADVRSQPLTQRRRARPTAWW